MDQLTFEELKPQAQTFIDQLFKADFTAATAHFDQTMKNMLTEDKLKEAVQQLTMIAGPFKQQAVARTMEMAGQKILIVACQFERAIINAQVVFNDQGQISGLNFTPEQPAACAIQRPCLRKPVSFPRDGSDRW